MINLSMPIILGRPIFASVGKGWLHADYWLFYLMGIGFIVFWWWLRRRLNELRDQ